MKCQYNCGFSAFRENLLRKHELMYHEAKNSITCETCGYATNRRDCYNRHISTLIHKYNVEHNAKNGVIDSSDSSSSLLDTLRPPSINPLVNKPRRMTPLYMQYLAIAQKFQKPPTLPTTPVMPAMPVKLTIKPAKPLKPAKTLKFDDMPVLSQHDAECPACTFKTPCKFTLKSHLVEQHEDYLIKEYNLNFDYLTMLITHCINDSGGKYKFCYGT